MNHRKAVERVIGNIKWNLGFKRFTWKGFESLYRNNDDSACSKLKEVGAVLSFIFMSNNIF